MKRKTLEWLVEDLAKRYQFENDHAKFICDEFIAARDVSEDRGQLIHKLETRIHRLKEKLALAKSLTPDQERENLEVQLNKAFNEVATLREANAGLTTERNNNAREIDRLKAEVEAVLSQRNMLANQKDIAVDEMTQMKKDLDEANGPLDGRLAALREERDDLFEEREVLKADVERLKMLGAETREQLGRTINERDHTRTDLETYKGRAESQETDLTHLRAEKANLKEDLDRVRGIRDQMDGMRRQAIDDCDKAVEEKVALVNANEDLQRERDSARRALEHANQVREQLASDLLQRDNDVEELRGEVLRVSQQHVDVKEQLERERQAYSERQLQVERLETDLASMTTDRDHWVTQYERSRRS